MWHRAELLAVPLAAAKAAAPALSSPPTPPSPPSPPRPVQLLAPLSNGDTVELPPLDPSVPRPSAVLGYPLGSRFTHWEHIAAYFDALAAASPRVKVWEYGRTY